MSEARKFIDIDELKTLGTSALREHVQGLREGADDAQRFAIVVMLQQFTAEAAAKLSDPDHIAGVANNFEIDAGFLRDLDQRRREGDQA